MFEFILFLLGPFCIQPELYLGLRKQRLLPPLDCCYSNMGNSSKDDSTTDGDTSGGDTPPSNSSRYSEGEKVLAYHGPRIYEAKAPFTSLTI
ncbi:hypothetical protein L6164_027862 [Bauhinia variegata]|uniref:Uncharacterized protein n=1 Tax=Bauhinia variegata TaxID=167791 RepID=A0ACB9LUK7_BAUVA|nr:hypothetical protein L6164_027862 [Bauhinia variegata]